MTRLLLSACVVLGCGTTLAAPAGSVPDWVLASADARATAGARFEILVLSLGSEPLPEEIAVCAKAGGQEILLNVNAEGAVLGRQRVYAGIMPAGLSGTVELDLAGRASSVLVLLVAQEPEAAAAAATAARQAGDVRPEAGKLSAMVEPPITENDPMYFVLGAREGYSARFQLSFKYRLFDQSGLAKDQPWLAGFYFGYTQNSLWDLSAQSRPFRDTSYRPSLFWKWERTDDKTWIDVFRLGVEHESNGGGGIRSRSINTAFVRPEWNWAMADGGRLDFTPKLYGYLDKADNPDIGRYRGNVDWRLRYDSGHNWITTGVARLGSSGKGSLLLDLSRRVRDLKFGPVGGYLHFQFFTGYGEDILDYNMRRKTQLRVGFAIVP